MCALVTGVQTCALPIFVALLQNRAAPDEADTRNQTFEQPGLRWRRAAEDRNAHQHEAATGDGNQRECTDACAAGVVLAIPANRKGERVGDGETDDMGGYLPPRALKHAGLPVLRDCSRSEVKG